MKKARLLLSALLLLTLFANVSLAQKQKDIVIMTCVTVQGTPDEISLVQFAQASDGVPDNLTPKPFDKCTQAVAYLLRDGFSLYTGQIDVVEVSQPNSTYILK